MINRNAERETTDDLECSLRVDELHEIRLALRSRILQAEIYYVACYVSRKKKGLHRCKPLFLNGAGTRSRTRDLLITSQLLYQLSYTGVLGRRL